MFLIGVTKSICTAPWTLYLTLWKYQENKCLHIPVYLGKKLLCGGGLSKFYKVARCLGDDDDDFFCCIVDRRKTSRFISSQDYCQRSSSCPISDTPPLSFEPALNLSSGYVERCCTVVITTTPRRLVECFNIFHFT